MLSERISADKANTKIIFKINANVNIKNTIFFSLPGISLKVDNIS